MAKTKIKRSPNNQATLGVGDIASINYNGRAGGQKSLTVGPELRVLPSAAAPQVSGFTANTATTVQPGTILMLYNNSSTVAWVTAYQSALNLSPVSPTGVANAAPVPPNAYFYLNMGESDTLWTSAATVLCYIVEDDTSFSKNIVP